MEKENEYLNHLLYLLRDSILKSNFITVHTFLLNSVLPQFQYPVLLILSFICIEASGLNLIIQLKYNG